MGHAENTAYIVYILIRCLAMDVVLLRAFASAGMCLPSRFLEILVFKEDLLEFASTTS
jgi:hypothetical protein